MKKRYAVILIVVAFVVGMMAGVGGFGWADQPIKVYINGKEMVSDQPPVIINDRVLVPLRAVSENIGLRVDWDGESVKITDETPLKRPPISGETVFVAKVNESLDMLEQKDFPHYALICQLKWPIIHKSKSGTAAIWGYNSDNVLAGIERATNNHQPAIMIYDTLVGNEKYYDATFIAGILAHEASHAVSNKHENWIDITTKKLSETVAYENELTVFRLIDAPKWMQDQCISQINRFENLK